MSTVYGTYPMASTEQSLHDPITPADKLVQLRARLERDVMEWGPDSEKLQIIQYQIAHFSNLNGEYKEAYEKIVDVYPKIEADMGEAGCACLAARREYITAAKHTGHEDEAKKLWDKGIEIVKRIDPAKKFREEQETLFVELGSQLGYEF